MNEAMRAADADASLGSVGRYVLRRELASGGMATVYVAHLAGPHGFEKVVAVKRIHPHLTKDRRFVEMFLDEARVAALIHHPNVCSVADFGEEKGAPFLVMEYLAGQSLAAVMRVAHEEGGMPFWLGARLVHDAARGLHAAHELNGQDGMPLGVVHRDVSPQNVFVLYDGVTKVVDFGVARARGRLTITGTDEVKGKLSYMSPEQVNGEIVDRRTDVWALGVVLWETTVSKRLFRGDNDGATLKRILEKPVPLPSDHRDDYPRRLETIVMKCLERDPRARYQTTEELAEDLEEFLYATGKPSGASQVKRWMNERFPDAIARNDALVRGEPAGLEVADDGPDPLRPWNEPIVGPQDATPTWPPHTPPRGRNAGRPAPADTTLPDAEATRVMHGVGSRIEIPKVADEPTVAPKRGVLALLAGTVVLGVVLLGMLASRREPAAVEAARATIASPSQGATATSRPAIAPSPPSSASASPNPAAPPPPSAAPTEVAPTPVAAASSTHAAVTAPTPTPVAPRASSTRPRESRPVAPRATSSVAPSPSSRATSSAPGTLSLLAIPPATVRLGGRSLGETPLVRLELAPGDHRLDLRTRDGRTQSIVVHIESGQPTRRRVEF